MGHLSYEESKKLVFRGLILLAVVTLIEVAISLFGKGHIVPGMENSMVVAIIAGLLIIILSLYKAYFIIYKFMHMEYEAKGLAMTVLLPTLLLVWAVIAFFQEGKEWGDSREVIKDRNNIEAQSPFIESSKRDIDTKIIESINEQDNSHGGGEAHEGDTHNHEGGDSHNHEGGNEEHNHEGG